MGNVVLMNATSSITNSSYRVITFGASSTANREGLRNYTAMLAEKFPQVEFINKGVGGNSTAMAAKRLQDDVLDLKPDLVVIQFGINDASVDVWKTPPETSSRVSLGDYEKNLRDFVDEIRNGGGEVILMTPNQVRWTPKLREMYGKPPYDPEDPRGFTKILEGYAQAVRDVSRDLKVPIVDVYAFYDTPERSQSDCADLLPDGMHPSEEGHAWVAAELGQLLAAKVASS